MEKDPEDFWLRSATELGWYFLDGQADGLWIENPLLSADLVSSTAFKILQASRSRQSETEYIACPSCGRTRFDIQESLKAVKQATHHLRHLKIAVMGCIVNGPGEMADADYGYVGSGEDKISLYRGKEMVKKHIPAAAAVRELVNLIKSNDDWTDAT